MHTALVPTRRLRAAHHHFLSGLAATLLAGSAMAQAVMAPFEVAISPSRLELQAKPGQRLGQSLRIYNVGKQVNTLAFRTMDWSLSEASELKFHDDLQPDSCRPWVALERRTRQIAARANEPYRFQVSVPEDAPRGECRFMIAIEGVDPAQVTAINSGGTHLNLPVSGRIAVTVYVAVGGAKPQLELVRIGTDNLKNERRPVIVVRNTGDAHGRVDGSLDVVDAKGQQLELIPDGAPVLPGRTRTLALSVRDHKTKGTHEPLQFPLQVSGKLDWDDGAFKVDAKLP
jgi:fimbrial chaperone protein